MDQNQKRDLKVEYDIISCVRALECLCHDQIMTQQTHFLNLSVFQLKFDSFRIMFVPMVYMKQHVQIEL